MKKWQAILLALLVLWAGVSVYYYQQHRVVMYAYPFYEEIELEGGALCLTEVQQLNYLEPNYSHQSDIRYTIASKLPHSLVMPFLKTAFFYSHPYVRESGKGFIQVNGIYSPHQSRVDSSASVLDEYDIWFEEPVCFSGGAGAQSTPRANFSTINAYYKRVLDPELPATIRLKVEDKLTGQVQEVQLKPHWQKQVYGFFNRAPQKQPGLIESLLIARASAQDWPGVQELFTGSAADTWQKTKHDCWEKYLEQGYLTYISPGVYQLRITFNTCRDEHWNPIARQVFTISPGQGDWRFTEAGPLEKLM